MDSLTTCFFFSLMALHVPESQAFSSGPPVGDAGHESLCMDMFPSGHGADAQTSTAPYDVVLSGSCYKAGTTLKVRIRIDGVEDPSKYFEGFFTQAKNPGTDNTDANHGTFDDLDTASVKTLNCFDVPNSAISHSEHEHFWARTFEWTAPDSDMGDIQFVSTIVKGLTTFWVDVHSDTISYDANCMADNTLADEDYNDIADPDCSSSEGSSSEEMACGADVINATFVTLLLSLTAALMKVFL